MRALRFHKYQGTGNDFLIADNREGDYSPLTTEQIERLCDRRFGIGADGLMLLENKEGADFLMRYFNADGRPGSFCGNGARCITRFAHLAGIQKDEYVFYAADGRHCSRLLSNGSISLLMQDTKEPQAHNSGFFLDTGSPHLVMEIKDLDNTDVVSLGRSLRNSERYHPHGVNVNFIQRTPDPFYFRMRTYERGVEDETYSCGTGAVAAALTCATPPIVSQQMTIQTKGGELEVRFTKKVNGFGDIWLSGPAKWVFETRLDPQHFFS
ncbi:MAG: diaminopimelate epimerase [Sphingomonadales bacterium]